MPLDCALQLHRRFIQNRETLALAESCTGGAIAAHLVSIPGASNYFLGSIVAYSNDWKERFLDVSPVTLQREGAVSEPIVHEMAMALFHKTDATYVLTISGLLAPPEGNSSIYLALGRREEPLEIYFFEASPERQQAIAECVKKALQLLWQKVATR